MFIEKLDRQQWSLSQAYQHISRLSLEQYEREKAKKPVDPNPPPHWNRSNDPARQIPGNAHSELIIALRDGDLHAKGRHSDERRERFSTGFSNWEYHSGHYVPISPDHWRGGRLDHNNQLEYRDGQFIDIQVPRFVVLTIWPELPAEMPAAQSRPDGLYTTPYLELMQAAIREYGLTATHQDKKESLVAWFLEQKIDDEPLSKNLADAMATLIRLPQSQRGGAKRMIGLDVGETV